MGWRPLATAGDSLATLANGWRSLAAMAYRLAAGEGEALASLVVAAPVGSRQAAGVAGGRRR